MILPKAFCLAFAVLSATAAYAQKPIPAEGKEKPFTREDYERYFVPGRFASKSVFYQSEGTMDVISNVVKHPGGRYALTQTIDTLDTSANYDLKSGFPYYKVRSRVGEEMLWDDRLQAYVFEYSNKDFDEDASLAWESRDNKAAISKGDSGPAPLHKFYNDADRRAGNDVKAIAAQYRKDVVGMWVWRCFYKKRGAFDVECRAVHQPTGRSEDYSYRKLDLVS